jgi:Uma2 family endonuclease
MTLDEFESGNYEEGYQYELIDGKLYESPLPNLPQGLIDRWILRKLDRYTDGHSEILNAVFPKARVFVHGRRAATCPEPDVAAYRDFPLEADYRDVRWQDVSPALVVEVLSEDNPDKDMVRNIELYLQVPSIREYWILDGSDNPNRPRMLVYRRRGQRWQNVIEIAYGESYTTRLLPGFELVLDPRR